jgi:predicted Zn-dependent protease
MKRQITRGALAALALLLLHQCATVPLTGRSQLLLFPENDLVQMSLTSYTSFLQENTLSTDIVNTSRVKAVGARISKAVNDYLVARGLQEQASSLAWEFNLVASREANAWCMPGGKVVFYEGILPYCANDNGIATVMGHEIAHAIAHHSNERMSQQTIVEYGSAAALAALDKSKSNELTKTLIASAVGMGTTLGVTLPFSRKHEYEADHMGLIFMAMAGYDPNEAVAFWTRMATAGEKGLEFFSTHPSDAHRVARLKEYLPEALKYKP